MNPRIKSLGRQSVAMLTIALLLTIGPGGPVTAGAQQEDTPPPAAISPDQLDSLVANIALYPDPLLAQVLPAATFPTDVVAADRWVKQHKNLKGSQLTDAVVKANLPYDPSIISLIQFPTVLDKMSQQLDWTTSLGNAFLTQRGDVMDSVQRMRRKAEKMGNLKSSEQVKVVSSPTVIEIQPANPQVIYVPTYSPQVVYAQPAPPPGPSTGAVVATGLISFGLGVAVGAASQNSCCWYGGSVGWRNHTVVVANNSFNRTWATRAYVPAPPPYYRPGGPYPAGRPPISGNYNRNNVNVNNVNVNNVNRNTANVNKSNRNTANVNQSTRGSTNVSSNRGNADNRGAFADRGAADNRNRGIGGGAGQREGANRGYSRADSEKASAFSGAQNGRSEQAASKRGQASRAGQTSRGSRQR
jgi:hypothetical protein